MISDIIFIPEKTIDKGGFIEVPWYYSWVQEIPDILAGAKFYKGRPVFPIKEIIGHDQLNVEWGGSMITLVDGANQYWSGIADGSLSFHLSSREREIGGWEEYKTELEGELKLINDIINKIKGLKD
jgi:hypothetical protein